MTFLEEKPKKFKAETVYDSIFEACSNRTNAAFNGFQTVKVSNLRCPRETDFDSDDHLTISSLAGFEPTQTDLDSVVSTAWLRPVRFTSDELIQKLPAGALDFKTCLSNNFPEKVLMEDHHGLDLVEEEKEQITHQTFKFDPNNLEN
ncbi:hypothetical protein C8R48DRAFT_670522 [Suillus tomentosus]|nr:hypothetical protein C8R48DRAFT_670522 [Suillus tomentosus]